MHKSPERWFGPFILVAFAAVLLVGFTNRLQHGKPLHGAGATFPAPLYNRWIPLFEKANGHVTIEYTAIGSGGGINAITSRDTHFGASDALMDPDELAAAPDNILQIPMALGSVVIAYNLPGLDGQLTLNAETITSLYLGEITRWNDPRLQAINPDLTLPEQAVRVARREDSSGTTFIFTDYLTTVSPQWAEAIGRGKVVDWPVSDHTGFGNDGVAQQILLQPGGIGYMEFNYAANAGLSYAAVINQAGNKVWPTVAAIQAAEESTPPTAGTILKESIVNAPGVDAYPIAGFTYMLVYEDLSYIEEPELAEGLVEYLEWSLTEGQEIAPQLNYTPIPESLQMAALELVEHIVIHHEE